MKKVFLALVVLGLMGLFFSASMTRTHYEVAKGGFLEKSFCNINQLIDCDTVLASPYARLGPFFKAEMGSLYYLFVVLAPLVAWARGRGRESPTLGFLFLSSLLAFLYSLYMAYISFFKIGALCLYCLGTYGVNLFLLILLGCGSDVKKAFGLDRIRSYALHFLAFLALLGTGILFFRGLAPMAHATLPEPPKEKYLQFFKALPEKKVEIPSDRPFQGDPHSKVTLVEFSDFQCPFCRRAAFSLKPYLGEFRNKVKIVFLNYPLDQACNPKITHSFHGVSCLAAKAVICADRAGKFWEYHDLVFENQPKLSRALLVSLAKEIGLDEEAFNRCLVSSEVDQRIAEDLALGNELGVSGTPAVFINGRPFQDWNHPERLRMVIESELK